MPVDLLIVTEYLRLVSTCNTHIIMNESLPLLVQAKTSQNLSNFSCSGGVESDSLSKPLVHSVLRGLVVNLAVLVSGNTPFRPVHIFHVELLALLATQACKTQNTSKPQNSH